MPNVAKYSGTTMRCCASRRTSDLDDEPACWDTSPSSWSVLLLEPPLNGGEDASVTATTPGIAETRDIIPL